MADALHATRAVRQAFDRAAPGYDAAAGVQREISQRLAGLMKAYPPVHPPRCVVDAGCGTGYGLQWLHEQFAQAGHIALDFAPAMLQRAVATHAARPLCADLQALPLRDACVDALWSSLALQWCEPARALGEFARVLRPGATAWIATLGPATLHELREAFAQVDNARHVLAFRSADEWTYIAETAGFELLERRCETASVRAADLRGVIGHLKGIGAHRFDTTPRSPLTRPQWRRLEQAYEHHRDRQGMLPATYDVILLALRRR
ncbi:MAG: malonyl-ACP O-methyltransferase BioC [Pseudazoarcus pumilus]|nr:malonyl-ACP O-methyltransferase BioC [Pseudazoarcus pumilus]